VAALSSIPYASPRRSTTVRHGAIIHDAPARESGNPPMRVRHCRQWKSGAIRRPGAFTSLATQARHVVAAAGDGRHPAGFDHCANALTMAVTSPITATSNASWSARGFEGRLGRLFAAGVRFFMKLALEVDFIPGPAVCNHRRGFFVHVSPCADQFGVSTGNYAQADRYQFFATEWCVSMRRCAISSDRIYPWSGRLLVGRGVPAHWYTPWRERPILSNPQLRHEGGLASGRSARRQASFVSNFASNFPDARP
jgi:hypothetical protein